MTTFHASCSCNQLTLQFSQAPRFQLVCHCNDCRKITGEAYLSGAFFAAEPEAIRGESLVETGVGGSGKPRHNHRCKSCGDFIFAEIEALQGIVAVNGKLLEMPFKFEPQAHVWVSQKLPEVIIPKDAMVFERRPALSLVMPEAPKPA
ncbi:GFA family protein [Paraperlucidibaca wandonensis]|jgi:hypothetical protein|uniref:GFA family protein n=1 Tax=Paraperlucidibaca wandonensis TaxID=1268273 RepID=A0ABW3HJD3_9GAMM|nr:GFA family protein [Paraperlucidibaca sp.]MBQ0721985.1 GFA family protein [Paraperlucidibaca sp.]MBQ0841509.1 GFA family protein [Paraperlucidibaca sp.]|tara:strand:- start:2461 stop:2904 length:444 start_codon:yes stop_codon:yes gene_type:complete